MKLKLSSAYKINDNILNFSQNLKLKSNITVILFQYDVLDNTSYSNYIFHGTSNIKSN